MFKPLVLAVFLILSLCLYGLALAQVQPWTQPPPSPWPPPGNPIVIAK